MMRRKQLRKEVKRMQRQDREWGEEPSAKNRDRYWERGIRWVVWEQGGEQRGKRTLMWRRERNRQSRVRIKGE